MDIFKTYLFFSGYDEGNSYLVDTIFYNEEWWLVASWLENKSTGEKIPDRLVRLTGLRYQEVNDQRHRFLLNNAIRKSVMDGNPQEGFIIRQYPSVLKAKGPGSVN